jgi:hypothetical protein
MKGVLKKLALEDVRQAGESAKERKCPGKTGVKYPE